MASLANTLRLLWLLLPVWLCAQTAEPTAETVNATMYQTAVIQLENLLLVRGDADSLVYFLLDDAAELAGKMLWADALQVVQTASEMLADTGKDALVKLTEIPAPAHTEYSLQATALPVERPSASLETGVDYSRQSFDINPLDSDSSIVEQLQNPYLALNLTQPLIAGRLHLFFQQRFRVDNQYLNGGLAVRLENTRRDSHIQVEGSSHYYYSQQQGFSSFSDNRLQLAWNQNGFRENRWSAGMDSRFKYYPEPDSLTSSLYHLSANVAYEHRLAPRHTLGFTLAPAIYQNTGDAGGYMQARFSGSYRYLAGLNRFCDLTLYSLYQSYEYVDAASGIRDTADGRLSRNTYLSLEPQLHLEIPYSSIAGLEIDAGLERYWYSEESVATPDLRHSELTVIQKFYPGLPGGIGIGYSLMQETFISSDEASRELVSQSDVLAQGGVLRLDYFSLQGLFVNLEYRLLWKNYPNAVSNAFDTFYSDRFTQSLSLIGWLPLNRNWRVQIFANLEDERDVKFKISDSQSRILSAALLYTF